MSIAMSAGAAADLARCEREPISTPGAIQPHGAFLSVAFDCSLVAHASANLAKVLGLKPASVLGQPIDKVIDGFKDMLNCESMLPGSQPLKLSGSLRDPLGRPLQLHAFRSGRYLCLDIEALPPAGQSIQVGLVQSIIGSFSKAVSQVDVCDTAVSGLRTLTGYDRVMAYRFGDDGHGEVISEACNPGLEPYLGLRYPASDIPQIARALYLRQRVGSIADSSYRPVPLLGHPDLDDGVPLDMTHSCLRSVSPVHREYMRNMKTAASLTISLVEGNTLWGMLVCHHMTPKAAEPGQRVVAGLIGQVVSLMLNSLRDAETALQELDRRTTLSVLVEKLSGAMPLTETFATSRGELLELVGATGALVCLSDTTLRLGVLPPAKVIDKVLSMPLPSPTQAPLTVDDLGLRYPDLASSVSDGCGALVLPLASGDRDLIAWFRPEQMRSITWGGNPKEHGTWDEKLGRVSPRASFVAWKETVSGLSTPWTGADIALAQSLRTAVTTEISQRTRDELAKLRHYDPLTGLANRSLLQERLATLAMESSFGASLLFLDLDRFKAVNDSMGHSVGDALLIEVAHRLIGGVRPNDLVVRLGGDEFVVLCTDLRPDEVERLGERLRQRIDQPFEIAGRWCHVSASIGIASTSRLGDLDLLQAADIAMYSAKKGGGNRSHAFEPILHEATTQQMTFDHDLRDALERNQLMLEYQPIFALSPDGESLKGFEALIRWAHPEFGRLMPERFIPLAERLGHIHAMGDWVLATAIQDALIFRRARPELDLQIYVNVSPLQIAHTGFIQKFREILRAHPELPPQALCIEITETVASDTIVVEVLAEVRAMGVRVAIDDFGTGFSSLSCLRTLPVDVVKIDRQFLSKGVMDCRSGKFFGILNELIHSADMRAVQEGIETQAQLDFMRAAGADLVQGYYLSFPLTIKEATRLAREQGRDAAVCKKAG